MFLLQLVFSLVGFALCLLKNGGQFYFGFMIETKAKRND